MGNGISSWLVSLFLEVEYDRPLLSPFFEFPENVFFLLKLPHYQTIKGGTTTWGQPPNITLKAPQETSHVLLPLS